MCVTWCAQLESVIEKVLASSGLPTMSTVIMSNAKIKCDKAINDLLNKSNWEVNLDESSTSGVAMSSMSSMSDTESIAEKSAESLSVSAIMDELIDYETFRGPSVLVILFVLCRDLFCKAKRRLIRWRCDLGLGPRPNCLVSHLMAPT